MHFFIEVLFVYSCLVGSLALRVYGHPVLSIVATFVAVGTVASGFVREGLTVAEREKARHYLRRLLRHRSFLVALAMVIATTLATGSGCGVSRHDLAAVPLIALRLVYGPLPVGLPSGFPMRHSCAPESDRGNVCASRSDSDKVPPPNQTIVDD